MTTLSTLQARILRLVGDPLGQGYTTELLLDGITMAMDAILPWAPKTARTIIAGTGSTVYAKPADCYEVQSVEDIRTGEIIPQAVLSPGQYRGEGLAGGNNDWIEYPHGSLTFSVPLSTNDAYSLYYHAYWGKPNETTPETTVLEPPAYTEMGLTLYAAAYILLPSAVSVAEVRNWNNRMDSGQPEHNPMQKTANYLLQLFINEMNRLPKMHRAIK